MHTPLTTFSTLCQTDALRGDALELLQTLPETCGACGFFDPQHRDVLDKQAYGNEGKKKQIARCKLPQMDRAYINECYLRFAHVLRPSGYLFTWVDAFGLMEGLHLPVTVRAPKNYTKSPPVLARVGLISWNNFGFGNGHRARSCGDFVLVLQRPPTLAKATWSDHSIRARWTEDWGDGNLIAEKIDRKIHPHQKPAGLIRRLIAAVTEPGDLVVDPAAGSFVVMHMALDLGRRFSGCDLRAPTKE
jgi:site-specific DNA-methyltransferase (adenine-specific)